MPKKPKKPCKYPGCPNLTENNYCEKHAKIMAAKTEPQHTDPSHRQRYSRRWEQVRSAYVASHPLCERCAAAGRYVPVAEVHHILPLRDGGTNSFDNLMSLCRKCHAEVHAEMGTRSQHKVVYTMDGPRASDDT